MIKIPQINKSYIIEMLLSFVLYWIFVAPVFFLPQFQIGPVTYYLFLPAGVKLFAMMVFKWRGFVGIAVAAFTRLLITDPSQPWMSWFIVALSTSSVLYMIVVLGLKLFKVNKDLSNLGYYQVVALATVSSVVNGIVFAYGVNSLTTSQISRNLLHSGFAAIIANFAGNAIFVCALVLIMRHKDSIKSLINRVR
ncbi:hypothetical protein SAMN06295945_1128 [Polynucleobacter meluiroseus]|uniref:Uncharacterized protein n=1 Tax=Polynucleobacter meluiroseus TaxID=1938814 RepID=A0A240E1P7_9BURK|nr:hypothetical protein [Polynucleobacter meluiroseus]SNX28780.1 hypothetical protein SAMN06295945_1128 [Polynucleobacter meluiroseus]